MHRFTITAAFIVALILLPRLSLGDGDLRVQYGTRSLEAAQHIDAAIKLSQAKKSDEALAEINQAVKADPSCAMGLYWLALIKCDLGDIDGGVDAYKACAALDNSHNSSITTDAKTNLGIMLGQLKRYDESIYWFSRAITEDPDDRVKEQARVYRNLAITLHQTNQDLAASIAAITGREIDPDKIEPGMIDTFFKAGQDQEAARILALQLELPKIEARTEPNTLAEVTLKTPISDKITRLFADPKGQYVLAVPASDHYFILDTHADGPPTVQTQKITGGNISAACLAGGNLYVVLANPPAPAVKLVQIDPLSGKSMATWNLTGGTPTSIAVLPSLKMAYFPVDGDIHCLSLSDGKVTTTDDPGQFVTADLSEKNIYTRWKDEDVDNGHTVVIDGSPVYIESDHFDWEQTVVFKYYVTPIKLLTAAMRINAASNGYDVVISPDGQFVACAGGGGWRPTGGAGGYNIAVYPTADFNKVQNAFAIDAYPTGCTFNPVTHEFAGIRGGDVKIYHLATDTPSKPAITLTGHFNGQAAWSGDGRLLCLANSDGGISIYKEDLTPAETALSHTWWKTIIPNSQPSAPVAGAVAVAGHTNQQANPVFIHYALATDRPTLQHDLTVALATKPADQPMAWRDYAPYANPAAIAAIDDPDMANAAPGIHIYSLNKALAKDPQNCALKLSIAEATQQSGQTAAARNRLLDVIHTDAGRTDLTLKALRDLANISAADNQDIQAADALVTALILDRVNPDTIQQLAPLLEKLKFPVEAVKLKMDSASAGTPSTPVAAVVNLPPLANPPTSAPVLTAANLFQASAPSVVLVHCGNGAGTAVCVAPNGILITSLHVVAEDNQIEVFPFAILNGKAQRMHSLSAQIVARSEQNDLAILKVSNPPASMKPLAIAAQSPAVGNKVFALGNPGLGKDTLDLSLSDGIVSSTDRMIDNNTYIQHTAAVNPGNSGGPLFNDAGAIVALVCLKAHLEGVSFATPAKTIRDFYNQYAAGAGK